MNQKKILLLVDKYMDGELEKELQENRNYNDRLGFIRKVYSILAIQLSMTVFITGLAVGVISFQEWLQSSIAFLIVCLCINIVVLITLLCFKNVSRRHPTNIILLTIFTLSESFLVANIASYSDPVTVLIAAAMTLGVTVSVTAYACLTKTDFTTSRGILCGLVIGMLLFGIFTGVYYESRLLGMVFCLIFIIIYTIFIVIDTQMIAGGKRGQFSYDDYIVASLILYIDIIRLFLYMLRFLKK